VIANLAKLIGEDRPKWHQQAACRGMLHAFTSADLDEQVAVCTGDISPWASECPVRLECAQTFVKTTLEVTGMNDAYDNNIVYGGLKPAQLLKLCQRARRLQIEGEAHGREVRVAVRGS
jgi:hypothetical protein